MFRPRRRPKLPGVDPKGISHGPESASAQRSGIPKHLCHPRMRDSRPSLRVAPGHTVTPRRRWSSRAGSRKKELQIRLRVMRTQQIAALLTLAGIADAFAPMGHVHVPVVTRCVCVWPGCYTRMAAWSHTRRRERFSVHPDAASLAFAGARRARQRGRWSWRTAPSHVATSSCAVLVMIAFACALSQPG